MNKKYGVDMPITEAAYKILYERQPPAAAIGLLKMKLR
jgi:glycerol-3-phosphate dehydrogenase (NAD(P)+)